MIETRASNSFAEESGHAPCSPVTASAPRESSARRESVWIWLNLVCLDAPIVAVSWQWLLARSAGGSIAPGGAAALFLTAWLIYLADRLGDSLSVHPAAPTSLRQQFCRRHRSGWIATTIMLTAADIFVICTRLDANSLIAGAQVGACAIIYLLVNQARPSLWRILPVKEISIGFLFAAGTTTALAPGLTRQFLPAWFLFACLCALNCISIAVWERELDAAQERVSIATALSAIGRYLLPALCLLTLTSVALCVMVSNGRNVYACIAASAVLLGSVHAFGRTILPDTRTALADLVLLSPLVLLLAKVFG